MDLKTYEERFLLDYLWFGNSVLSVESRALEFAHASDGNPDRRRALLLAIHTLLLQQCERCAAWLLALRRWAEAGISPVETILRYGPGEAVLKDVMADVADGSQLLSVCGIDPAKLPMAPDEVTRRAQSMFEGFAHYSREQGTRAALYNKAKHGMVFYSSLRVLNPSEPDGGPVAMLAKDRRATTITPEYLGILDEEGQAAAISNQVVRLAHVTGDLIAMHLYQQHPESQAKLDRLFAEKSEIMMLDALQGGPKYS